MTLAQVYGFGFIAMAIVAGLAIYHGFKLQYKLNQHETYAYRYKVCMDVLKENRKMKGD